MKDKYYVVVGSFLKMKRIEKVYPSMKQLVQWIMQRVGTMILK